MVIQSLYQPGYTYQQAASIELLGEGWLPLPCGQDISPGSYYQQDVKNKELRTCQHKGIPSLIIKMEEKEYGKATACSDAVTGPWG